MMRLIRVTLMLGLFVLLSACASQHPVKPAYNPFTPGNVTLTLKRGVTTKTDVLEAFGAPNIVAQNDDATSTWTYQKNAVVTTSHDSNVFATILLAGTSSDSSGFEQSSRTMTLIIHFDKHGKVSGFRSLATDF